MNELKGAVETEHELKGEIEAEHEIKVTIAHGSIGKSAYQIAVEKGFVGTEEEWLASLHGKDGKSPYINADTGTWWVWDANEEAYADTGVKAKADELKAATPDTLGGIKVGKNLIIENGILSVDTAAKVEGDNTKPITSGAVYMEIGNIEILLSNI